MMASEEVDTMSSHEIAHAIFIEGRTRGAEMFRLLERLQARDPVFHFAEADIWIATGNEEVRQILRSPAAEVGFAARNDRTQPGWREHHSRTNMAEWMGHNDGAYHRRVRGAVNPAFMPRMADAAQTRLRPAFRQVVSAFKAKGGGDFLNDVGYAITTCITDYLLGLEGQNRPDFRHPIERMMKTFDFGLTEEQWREADEAATALRAFWTKQVRERLTNPSGDDLLAQLIRSGIFNEHELVLIAENVLAAGSDTTANTSTNALHLLLHNREQLALARADAKARANIPEEVMRLVSAAPSSGRRTVRELEAGGRTIPTGSVVIAILAAANRDPKVFPNPHRLDLLREGSSKAAGFGMGPHICLGQWFARAAIGILFDELLGQCRIIEFDGPPPEPMGIGMRQLPELLVKVG